MHGAGIAEPRGVTGTEQKRLETSQKCGENGGFMCFFSGFSDVFKSWGEL